MPKMWLVFSLFLFSIPATHALDVSAGTGNLNQRGDSNKAEITALTGVIEALGNDLVDTKQKIDDTNTRVKTAEDLIAEIEKCGKDGKVYNSTSKSCVGQPAAAPPSTPAKAANVSVVTGGTKIRSKSGNVRKSGYNIILTCPSGTVYQSRSGGVRHHQGVRCSKTSCSFSTKGFRTQGQSLTMLCVSP